MEAPAVVLAASLIFTPININVLYKHSVFVIDSLLSLCRCCRCFRHIGMLYLLFPILTSFIHIIPFKRRSSPRNYIRLRQFDSLSLLSIARSSIVNFFVIFIVLNVSFASFNLHLMDFVYVCHRLCRRIPKPPAPTTTLSQSAALCAVIILFQFF